MEATRSYFFAAILPRCFLNEKTVLTIDDDDSTMETCIANED